MTDMRNLVFCYIQRLNLTRIDPDKLFRIFIDKTFELKHEERVIMSYEQ